VNGRITAALLGESERMFGGLVRRALVTELTVGEPGQQMRLDDRDVPLDRGRAIFPFPSRRCPVRRITRIR
jgi:hypothetical protein